MGCVATKPIVDGIEKDYQGTLRVVRLDARNSENRELANSIGVQMTPTYVLFDANAKEVYRSSGTLNRGVIDELIKSINK
ncbi:MAG: thioredoxin family protein [Roseiflexaceae bacterium]